ncbi:MAG: 1-deoxy-D-xylulose-5-phosphate synthase [Clostridiales bacterium]|nr:1-deoxy-D-xylulose-5-phosphate synthase [Clostridiales bacterium]
MKLLEKIKDPHDLKKLSIKEMEFLAQEIRQFILENVAETGGHLASNLGVVELTLAIHYVFDSPIDKIIWDVGHQSYVHKILTSRKELFSTLRRFGGLSGFPKRSESIHDVFETGHSSTSLSAALGMAKARDLKKEKYNVIAVIGDGALTGGMALEALNDAGRLESNLIIILNDNEMSIAPNVGAMSSYLSKIRSNPRYKKVKKIVSKLLHSFPWCGNWLAEKIEKLKNSFKYLFVSGVLFEELGYTYMGPVDGHDLPMLVRYLNQVKQIQGPTLIHVVTQKGKGYYYSETNPVQYHGVSPFDLKKGKRKDLHSNGLITFSDTLGLYLVHLARQFPELTAITAAMPQGTGLVHFQKAYPHRFFDVGIAEQHAVTFAAGMAANGLKPVVAVYSTFLQRAYDQILHDVCRQNLPIIFAIDRAGLVGEDGDTHHGVFDISFLRHIPNLIIMTPKNTEELKNMLDFALKANCPVAIRYPKETSKKLADLPSGPIHNFDWEVLQDGREVAILATGSMVENALDTANFLNNYGIYPTVVNARIIKPLDRILLDNLAYNNFSLLVTMEDNVIQGGFGSAVNEYIIGLHESIKVINIGISDKFIEHGTIQELKASLNLDTVSLAEKILNHTDKGVLYATPEKRKS